MNKLMLLKQIIGLMTIRFAVMSYLKANVYPNEALYWAASHALIHYFI